MKELGEFLKKIREERGISLKEIQNRTKVSSRYLNAIEEGNFQIIPGEVYLKGFLRSYAETIGLNGDEIIEMYNDLVANKEGVEESEALEEKVKPERLGSVFKLLIILAIGAFLFWLFRCYS